MSTDSSETQPAVPWKSGWGIVFALLVFFGAQIIAGLVIAIYPALKHWPGGRSNNWLDNSVTAQFIYILLAEAITIGAIYLFLRLYKLKLSHIGLKKPRWADPIYALAAAPAYFMMYLLAVAVIGYFDHGLNINQQQQIGFNNVRGLVQMIMTFISLVVLPPLAEEIMVRGFLYSSFRKALKVVPAAILTSLLFAAAHLPEGGAAGPLYIAAIDTFVLSLVLIYLREKTGSLWAGIGLHALKNGVAFVALFVTHAR